jgi:galactokinase/mevalonate kinase-like predicted kinase
MEGDNVYRVLVRKCWETSTRKTDEMLEEYHQNLRKRGSSGWKVQGTGAGSYLIVGVWY